MEDFLLCNCLCSDNSVGNPEHYEFEVGTVQVGSGKLFLIAGPCVIESETHVRTMADAIQRITSDLGIPTIFKASYDKANRTSAKSFRGPGLEEGCRILRRLAEDTGLAVLTDVHDGTIASGLPKMWMCCRFQRFCAGRLICCWPLQKLDAR